MPRSSPSSKSSKPRGTTTAARRARTSDTTPASHRSAEVVLDIELADNRVYLVLANCGDAVATDISVAFSRHVRGLGNTTILSDLSIFKHLGVLRPGTTLRFFWDAATSLLATKEAAPFEAEVMWTESTRSRRRATYRHNPAIFRTWPECIARTKESSSAK